jgi:CRP-like cAMP-binding protein
LFRDEPNQELQKLAALAIHEQFNAGDVNLMEGGATNDLLIVFTGKVQVYVTRSEQKIHITELGPMSYFRQYVGVRRLPGFSQRRRRDRCFAYRIDRHALRSFLKTNPAAPSQMCTVFSNSLRNSNSALTKH